MNFTPTSLTGAYVIDVDPIKDERGFFARSFCQNEFSNLGLKSVIAQSNISYNTVKNTLRGMHYQQPPYAEAKLVTCISGSIFDVIIDIRPTSATYMQYFCCELTSSNRRSIYIPEGFAHGFQTLEDHSEVLYQMFDFFSPSHAWGIRWNDESFNIPWPSSPAVISDKDMSYSDFERADR